MLLQPFPIHVKSLFAEAEIQQFKKSKKGTQREEIKQSLVDLLDKASNVLTSLEAQIANYKNNEELHMTYINLVDLIAQIIINVNKL